MQKKIYNIILFGITLGLCFCKKESKPIEHDGILYYPTATDLNIFKHSGLSINGTKISFANGLISNNGSGYFYTGGIYEYNIIDQTIVDNLIDYDDTAKLINGLININPNRYLGFNLNLQKKTIANGDTTLEATVILLDKNFKTLKAKILPIGPSTSTEIHLKSLTNGDFIICAPTGKFYSKNYLFCLDENLNIKWTVKVENASIYSDDYFIKDVLVKDNAIYLLQNKISSSLIYGKSDYYRVKKYDFSGNNINTSVNSAKDFKGNYLIPFENGYAVVGENYNAFTDYTTFFANYDMNNAIVTTKILDKIKYSKFYPIKYNSPVVSSNIIECNKAFYFMTLEYQMVKLNSSLKIEWTKSIDNFSAKNLTNERYLVNIGNNIVCIGKNNWRGVNGITFIKTDLDGNIVK